MATFFNTLIQTIGTKLGQALMSVGPDTHLAKLYALVQTQASYHPSPSHQLIHRWIPHGTTEVLYGVGSLVAFALGGLLGSFWGGVGVGIGGGVLMILWWMVLHAKQWGDPALYPSTTEEEQAFSRCMHVLWARSPELKSFTEPALKAVERKEVMSGWVKETLPVLQTLGRYHALTWESLQDEWDIEVVEEVDIVTHIDTSEVFVDTQEQTPPIQKRNPKSLSKGWGGLGLFKS